MDHPEAKFPISGMKKTEIDDSTLSVTLTVGQLKALVREEIEKAAGQNGQHGDELLSAETAAQRWDVPVSKIQDMARRGELPCVRLGHYVRFKPADLEQFIKDRSKALTRLPTQLRPVHKNLHRSQK